MTSQNTEQTTLRQRASRFFKKSRNEGDGQSRDDLKSRISAPDPKSFRHLQTFTPTTLYDDTQQNTSRSSSYPANRESYTEENYNWATKNDRNSTCCTTPLSPPDWKPSKTSSANTSNSSSRADLSAWDQSDSSSKCSFEDNGADTEYKSGYKSSRGADETTAPKFPQRKDSLMAMWAPRYTR